MRALLVVNPAATTTSARTREVLASALEAELKLEVAHSRGRGHATELAREARADALDLVVVLGGDGTVNEVVNGLLGAGVGTDVPDLAVVPGGGTNVFSRSLGVPREPVEATGALLDALRERRHRSIGLGSVGLGAAGDRWFTFNAGMGWDAEVVARVDRRRQSRSTHRPTTPGDYVRAAAAQFFLHSKRRRPTLTLEWPGHDPVGGLYVAIIANTAPWTYLGDRALHTSPEASFETGLDVYALTRLRTAGTVGEVSRLLRGRPTPDRRGPRTLVHREHDLAELTLRSSRPVAAQVDGEPLGDLDHLPVRSVPGALRVVV
jgi:diacylglycerol kinase family enzyme